MFPVFPVLFPVCSHCPASGFMVFPAFPVFAARAVSSVSCIPFLHPREHWEQWEPDSNVGTFRLGAVEQTWNDREQEGLFQGWTSMSITH
jgi:hypothetical protein